MQAFADTTNSTINVIVSKKMVFSLDELISIIKEVYQYTLKSTPPSVDNRFIDWLLDKHQK